ncbi:hypothetical protein ScPMuIL_017840 [Solemya velum]
MEVDPPSTSCSGTSNLKRSNSAPMINVLMSTQESPSTQTLRQADVSRIRKISTSSMSLHPQTPTQPIKIPDRIHQIKQEEIQIADRETAREKEIRSAIQMSNSWDEFTLDDPEPMNMNMSDHIQRRPRSFSESLHIFTSPTILCGSPSPTRVGKQCFSPSMQLPVKATSFTPSPSPSPTRKTFLRSLSPIAVRPSPLGKRKLEHDGDKFESYLSPPKKFVTGSSTPDRIIAHPLAHSISSSSLEESSPDQMVPRTGGEVRTRSRPQPHMYGFMPLRDSTEMQTTDSETSDITESTDISESADNMIGTSVNSSLSGFSPLNQGHV